MQPRQPPCMCMACRDYAQHAVAHGSQVSETAQHSNRSIMGTVWLSSNWNSAKYMLKQKTKKETIYIWRKQKMTLAGLGTAYLTQATNRCRGYMEKKDTKLCMVTPVSVFIDLVSTTQHIVMHVNCKTHCWMLLVKKNLWTWITQSGMGGSNGCGSSC